MAGQKPVLAVLLLAALCYFSAPAFIAPRANNSTEQRTAEGVALGLGAGLLTAEPAHAGVIGTFADEIIPYSLSISFAIIWGIILGFVLLRLQEAFPE
eukprot:Skav224034  [mRNA]  locus=scaffold4539:75027:75320:- [translate_table: standard]